MINTEYADILYDPNENTIKLNNIILILDDEVKRSGSLDEVYSNYEYYLDHSVKAIRVGDLYFEGHVVYGGCVTALWAVDGTVSDSEFTYRGIFNILGDGSYRIYCAIATSIDRTIVKYIKGWQFFTIDLLHKNIICRLGDDTSNNRIHYNGNVNVAKYDDIFCKLPLVQFFLSEVLTEEIEFLGHVKINNSMSVDMKLDKVMDFEEFRILSVYIGDKEIPTVFMDNNYVYVAETDEGLLDVPSLMQYKGNCKISRINLKDPSLTCECCYEGFFERCGVAEGSDVTVYKIMPDNSMQELSFLLYKRDIAEDLVESIHFTVDKHNNAKGIITVKLTDGRTVEIDSKESRGYIKASILFTGFRDIVNFKPAIFGGGIALKNNSSYVIGFDGDF